MWMRNVLFLVLCFTGLALVGGNLLKRDRIDAPQPQSPGDIDQVVRRIDAEFRQHWQDKGFTPAARADDLTIARRLSLALTGTIPSLEEIRELENVPQEERGLWWLSHLLEDRRYADY